jgi:hypothetical protein
MRITHLIGGVVIAGMIATAAVGTAMSQSPSPAASTAPAATAQVLPKAELRTAMRKLWEDHINYTRNFIISALAGVPDTDARLMKNQEEIGNAVKPYYGNDAGTKLTALLKDHITIAADVVKEAKAGDKTGLANAQKKWTDNGKEIAAFLSGANPNWNKATLEQMLQKHLDLTTGEVTARLARNWAADIKAYDDGHEHMLMFADALTDGIARQFPTKFTA